MRIDSFHYKWLCLILGENEPFSSIAEIIAFEASLLFMIVMDSGRHLINRTTNFSCFQDELASIQDKVCPSQGRVSVKAPQIQNILSCVSGRSLLPSRGDEQW